jgi:hypothetical protein
MVFEAGSVIVRLIADTTGFSKGTSKTVADIGVMVAAAGAATYATQQLIDKYGSMAQELGDLSITTGMSTQALQRLQYAAALSGDSFDTVAFGIQNLSLKMAEARDPSSEAYKAFMGLGVDPSGRTPEEVFQATASALSGMTDTTQRNQIAQQLYGKSWKEMLPFMEDYIKNKEKIQKSPTFSDADLARMDEMKEKWSEYGKAQEFGTGKGLLYLDAIQTKLQKINPLLSVAEGLVSGGSGVLDNLLLDKQHKGVSGGVDIGSPLAKTSVSAATIDQASEMVSAIDTISDAYKKLQSAIKDASEEQKSLMEINKNYSRSLSTTNYRDVGKISSLIQQHQWDVEDQQTRIGSAKQSVAEAGGGLASAMSGAIGGPKITITGPIYLNGDKSFEDFTKKQERLSMGYQT